MQLSPREHQIIALAAQGHTAKTMAKLLELDPKTIETYSANARRKLKARNIAHAIYLALDQGILRM